MLGVSEGFCKLKIVCYFIDVKVVCRVVWGLI